ncbi:MAG: hypothetical protein HY040_08975 [Planctomycetes bacterium]|nr:hypothetical protein [Planctomycetota bacterium]
MPGHVPEGESRWEIYNDNYGSPLTGAPRSTLRIREDRKQILVDTDAAVFSIDPTFSNPIQSVGHSGNEVLASESTRLVFKDANGRIAKPQVEHVAFEERGPVRATLRVEGHFRGRSACRFVARLCFFAGTGLVRVRLTLHNPNRAKHRGGLWDLGDPGSILFRELALELDVASDAAGEIVWRAERGQPARASQGPLEIFQASSGGTNWQSKNHVDRHGRVPLPFQGYRGFDSGGALTGLRASPMLSLRGRNGTVTVAVPEFWQQFPKALSADGKTLRIGLFPGQFGDHFELQGGEQKTHTLWLHFGKDANFESSPLDWVDSPARAFATPEWVAESGAIPYLRPAVDDPDHRLQELLADVMDGPNSFFARREIIDEYGWRNFGELYADHEAEFYQGPQPAVSHYNNQYDVVYGTLLQFFRTGDARWMELHDALARHVIDIDIYHTSRDRAAYNGGLFWFTDHYKSAATCTHRTYSRANCQTGDRSYGGGPSSNHNFTTGLLSHYFVTGDPSVREAVLSLADWVVNMDDGRRTVLGLIDDGPTGLASCTGTLDYHGPGRGSGNSINALLDAWIVTGRHDYLQKAEQLIRRSIHPADDIWALDLLNVEKQWSYTVFLAVLARYLDFKAETGVLDSMFAYARASLLHYVSWMVENEVPYFDHPEKLKYPTEAWAGQEFRKANVLRLSAAYADDRLRSRLLRRGQDLADRAWSDLQQFASRTSARGAALAMVEGSLDASLRVSSPPQAPRPAEEPDFGGPESFVSQKHRVLTQLRSVRGFLRALWRLVNPWNWSRFWRLLSR